MKWAAAEKISTQEVYNNEFSVKSLHDDFAAALSESVGSDIVMEVPDDVEVGDSINSYGKRWASEA